MNRLTLVTTSLLALIGLCSTGCSALNVQKPTVAFKSADVKDVTADGFTLNYQATVKNPNAAAIPLSNVNYGLALGGKNVLDGKADMTGEIPASGSKDLMLPVRVTWEHLLTAEQAIVKGRGDVPYTFKGSLSLPNNPLMSSVPFSYSDTLSVKKLLRDAPQVWKNPAARKLATQLLGNFLGGSSPLGGS